MGGTLRRVLFGAVDPRPLALFRIAFGACLLALVFETAPLGEYLFSDEGLLTSAALVQVRRVPGLGPDGPQGLGGWIAYIGSGQWSLLHLCDAPWFVDVYIAMLGVAAVALMIGWHTRVASVAAWFLLAGLLRRGDAHYGGEQVFTAFLFILMFADSGAAASVDDWRRKRRSTGVDIHRRIPAWPQWLIVGQLVLAYAVNGWTKTGPTWISGDTLRLAMHVDRYTRLDWHELTLALGAWPLRLATWSVLWWERLFVLVLVGMWLRASQGPIARRLLSSRVAVLFDPRPYLVFGLLFHGIGMVLFEIGAFVGATVSAYVLCWVGIDAKSPVREDRDDATLPLWAWIGAVVIVAVAGVVAIATGVPAWWYGGWVACAIALVVVGRRVPLGRLAAGLLIAHHICALLLWQTPAVAWRDRARSTVEWWMELTYTRQRWSMFAPNGPQRNQTVRTTVVVGERSFDLRTELELPENLGRPYLLHDRWRKVDEAISGYREWLAPWHARYVCRRWALDHHGEVPTEVVLERVVAGFAPADVVDRVAWFWAHAEIQPIVRITCADDPHGAPANGSR